MDADDLTVYAIVNNVNDRIKLQNELNNLLEWSKNGNLILILTNIMFFTLLKKIYVLTIALIINIAIHFSICGKCLECYLTQIDLLGAYISMCE